MAQSISGEKSAATPASPSRMTFEEYLDWLDEDKHAEWVNGEVVMHSPVSRKHTNVGSFLLAPMKVFVDAHQLGFLAYEPLQMKISMDLPSRSPDLLFVAKENMDRVKSNYLEGPADLVVEIVSPESRGRDRGDKFDEYERGGIQEYWLVDPERKRAEFYLLGEDGMYNLVPVGTDGIYRSTVLQGVWLRVSWLWQDPLPSVLDVLKEWGTL
jgi:Uma2 family endonuclease